jgi:hypothetical protein
LRFLAITAGIGNGWEFPASVLKEFVPLLNKVHRHLDHSMPGHSVKDLAGVIHSPAWDEGTQGIRAAVCRPTGPGANASITLGDAALAQPGLRSVDVGFSATGPDPGDENGNSPRGRRESGATCNMHDPASTARQTVYAACWIPSRSCS